MNSPRLTAIGSGKGGTGKTLLAVNLAYAFALEGERVLLCDADLGLSNTTVHLGLGHGGDLAGVMTGDRPLEDAVAGVFGGGGVRGGFDLLAAPSGSGALANVSADAAARLTDALKDSTDYDRVLLDLGAGVDAATLRFAASADEAMLVVVPDPAALTDAYAFVKLALRMNAPMPSVVVNMAGSESEGRRVADALVGTCRSFLKRVPDHRGTIPRDARATESVRRQVLLLKSYPQSAASRAVEALARRLTVRHDPLLVAAGVPSLR